MSLDKRIKIGDIVVVVNSMFSNTCDLKDKSGVVSAMSGGELGIMFEESIGGHNLNGHILNNNGWFINPINVKKLYPIKDVITFGNMGE